MQYDTLVLTPYKEVTVLLNNQEKKIDLPIGKRISSSIEEKMPELKNIQYEITDRGKLIEGLIMNNEVDKLLIE